LHITNISEFLSGRFNLERATISENNYGPVRDRTDSN
jgi:hypothetical protein